MSEPDVVLPIDVAEASADLLSVSPARRMPRRGLNFAEWMLVIATAIWGMSFALAKNAGEAMNRAAGFAAGSPHVFGPIAVLAMRFTLATVAWLAIVPAARRGWTARGVARGAGVGAVLATGLILQHLALDRTTEAVAAFLTSLTVIFVPMILWLALGHKFAAATWLGVAVALPGVWLMSDARSGFSLGLGELLGIACAFVFAWHLPFVNACARTETPYRMAAAQFAVVAVGCWIVVFFSARNIDHFDFHVLATTDVWLNLVLLVALPTLVSFGLANVFQPRVEPVRAVLVYLLEPIFAASFAWLWSNRGMTRGMVAGGVLILAANAIVELLPVMKRPVIRDARR